jgi:outer membrane receptor for ferrienterochelin and colicins
MIVKVVNSQTSLPIENVEVIELNKKRKYKTDDAGLVRVTTENNQFTKLLIRSRDYTTIDTSFIENGTDTLVVSLSEKLHSIEKDVVVTATRSSTSKEESPLRISVIDSKQLEQTQSVTLAEGLQYQQGLRLENNCQNCGTTQIRINGLEGPYSQILIDSKPIFSTVSGVYGLEQIPSSMIESIEVLRGGASSMYGGNAVGGVINVLTKEPLANTAEFSTTGTSFGKGSFELTSQLYGTIVNDDFTNGLTVYGTSRQRDPFDANGDDFSEIARLRQNTIGTKLYVKPTKQTSIKFGYSYINEDRRGGNKFELEPHQADITEWIASSTHLATASIDYQPTATSTINLYSGFSLVDRESYYGANQDSNAYGTTDNQLFLIGTSYIQEITTDNFGDHLFTTGIEAQYEGLKDIALGYNRNLRQIVRQQGLYFQDNIQLYPYLDAIVGLRIDKHSMVNNLMLNPRMSIKYSPIPSISLRGNYSTGYRAPQAFNEDLHIQVVNGDLQIHLPGNNLREERSKSYSLNIEHRYSDKDFNFTSSFEAFSTTLDGVFVYNNIGKDPLGNQVFERVNGNNSVVNGVTIDVSGTYGSSISMRASFTSQRNNFSDAVVWSEREVEIPGQGLTLLEQTSNQYLRTPNNYGFFSLTVGPFSSIVTSISGVYTGSMLVPWYQENEDILLKTQNFFDVMVQCEYSPKFLQGIEVTAGLFNIFQSYQPIFDSGINRDAGFTYGPLKPRSIFLGVRYSLL